MKDGKIESRLLRDKEYNYKMLEKWYQEKEVYSNFEQRKLTYKEIKNKYLPRTSRNAKKPVFMIEYDNKSVGIIQYQLISEENKKLYNINFDNCYEIDIFIGDLNLHNKGIGRKSISLLSKYLLEEKKANLLVMCPLKKSTPAIRCYEHCEFKIQRIFKTKDTIGDLQEFILMVKEK